MMLNITSKQMDITPAIKGYIEDKFSKLNKWQALLINPHIILSKESNEFIADATIGTKGSPLVASAKNSDMYLAINELMNKLEKQLNKVKHKPEARRASESIKDYISEDE